MKKIQKINLLTDNYYNNYIAKVTEEELIVGLENDKIEVEKMIKLLNSENENFAYEDNKWTSKQLFQHIIDCELIFLYRALRYSRNDKTELPGFDENKYAESTPSTELEVSELLEFFLATRNASLAFFKSIAEKNLDNKGVANGIVLTPRTLGFVILGHNKHHISVLKEKYILL